MGVTGLTCLIISILIYHLLAVSILSRTADGFQTFPQNLTQCSPRNITVQLKNMSVIGCPSDVNMACCTNLHPNQTFGFEWWNGDNKINSRNQSTIQYINTSQVSFTCIVLSPCGNFSASLNKTTKCNTGGSIIILLICAVGAVFVILMFGITMKVMLKKGEVQRQVRRQQRQVRQNNDSTAAVTSTW